MKKIIIGLWAFAIIFILIGLYLVTEHMASQSWNQTTATIVRSGVQRNVHMRRVNNQVHTEIDYDVEATYKYTVDGKSYTGNRYDLGKGTSFSKSFNKRTDAKKWLEASPYKKGSEITIYYDPENPSESMVSKSFNAYLLVPFFISMLFMVLIWIINYAKKHAKTNQTTV